MNQYKLIDFLPAVLCIFLSGSLWGQIQFEFGSEYRFIKGIDAAEIPVNWMFPEYDDSSWESGPAPFRYGDGSGGTLLSDMRYNYTTFYLRTSFTAANIECIKEIEFQVNFDDGFILWLNGNELISRNAPTVPAHNALATALHESGTIEYFLTDSSNFTLNEGNNTIAIQCFNAQLNSTDIYFDIGIQADLSLPQVPDSIPVSCDYPSGFYTDPFDLTLTSPSSEYQIVYTLDGSNPQSSETSITEDGPVVIRIDPSSSENRPATPLFVVRASLVKPDFAPSGSIVRNLIFLEAVREQQHPGGGWPSGFVNNQVIDLDMDADVLNDSRYKYLFDEAMFQIPSISIATDREHLFDPSSGIYVNAREHGSSWERDCSVELLYQDGRTGFQLNAGLRIRGGNSRKGDNPKHAFRLFFREKYGAEKLRYPLFGINGADQFDKLDLRTAQNYSWSMDGSEHNTFVRDIFSRDSQLDMGNPSTRGDYVHLFLNGMYWGLFQTEERPEARYAETYFGDDKEDYDIIKVAVDQWPYFNEATDGNMDAWTELWQLCEQGFGSNEAYYGLEGKDENGTSMINSRVLVDIDNLIDYMLVIFYTGNVDAPVSAWHNNDMPNNFYAIFNRKNKGSGFIFLAHDSEHCMFTDPIYVHDGLYENRVTIDDPPMAATGILDFQPQWLHQKLCENSEYRIRFADRAFGYLSPGGALSTEQCGQRFSERAAEIDMAIISESARWGDAKVGYPRNKIDDWEPEIDDIIQNLIPYRTEIVIDQLTTAGLYTDLVPPLISMAGETISGDFVFIESQISILIENDNSNGTIYYTLDGRDPRMTGGNVSASSNSSEAALTLNLTGSAIITARIKHGDDWSAVRRVSFSLEIEDYSMLKVTELHYHPPDIIDGTDTTGGKAFEFIELKNTGSNAINISGIRIDSAVTFRVPEGTLLAPNQFYVIASKPEKFYEQHGMTANGNFSGNFNNSGEYVHISDPNGDELVSFTYSDDPPWPPEADGDGYSLTATEILPQGYPGDPGYWRKSYHIGGSPFADDLITAIPEPLAQKPSELLLIPNPTSDLVGLDMPEVIYNEIVLVRIIDMRGRSVIVEKMSEDDIISLSEKGISKGIYMVHISYSAGSCYSKLIYK